MILNRNRNEIRIQQTIANINFKYILPQPGTTLKKRLYDIYTKTGGKEIKRRKRKKAILAVKWKQ